MNAVEELIDKYGLSAVLERIGQICYEKSEHIQANHQGDMLAVEWARAGSNVNTVAYLASIKNLVGGSRGV